MKTKATVKGTWMGVGVGLVLFAVTGLLPGSLLGGVMGLNVAGMLFGTPVTSGILERMLVGGAMMVGVMVAGIMYITATGTAGWLLGTALDALTGKEAVENAN